MGTLLNTTVEFRKSVSPFTWHLARGLLTDEQLRTLNAEQPTPDRSRRAVADETRRDKQYRMNVLPLLVEGRRTPAAGELSRSWSALLEQLESEKFLGWLGDNVDIELRGLPMEIGVFTYRKGDFISLHKDKPTKALTAILYLNEHWPADGGGCFEVRDSGRSADAPVESVPPVGGQLLAFPPSDTSWHAVSRIETDEVTRLTVQLEFWLAQPGARRMSSP